MVKAKSDDAAEIYNSTSDIDDEPADELAKLNWRFLGNTFGNAVSLE